MGITGWKRYYYLGPVWLGSLQLLPCSALWRGARGGTSASSRDKDRRSGSQFADATGKI